MSMRIITNTWMKTLLAITILVTSMSGCMPWEDDQVYTRSIGGSVGDGPVVGATVTIYSSAGEVLGVLRSDSSASYRSTVKAKGKDYPLRLVATGGTDLVTGTVPDFDLVSVVAHPSEKNANINPFSTLIVSTAETMPGGLTAANVGIATGIVMNRLGFGLDGAVIADPITAEIDNSLIAHIVKASEMFGEMIRRTRDLLANAGQPVDGNAVMHALGHDLVDGVLDGQGGALANAATAAVANVVSAQVLLEAVSNNLKVGGAIATQILDMSIVSTHSGVSGSQLTANVSISQRFLDQFGPALAAVQVLDAGQVVADIAAAAASLSAGMLPGQAAAVLPVSASLDLDHALSQAPFASDAVVEAINTAATIGTGGMGNTAPTIDGNPSPGVTAGNTYNFVPTVFDADGDSLTFSINNRPSWASFDSNTGRLSGVPAEENYGSYGNIVISVTDGTDSASLDPFSVQVDAAPVVNTPPVISGGAAATVTAGTGYIFRPAASDADGDTLVFSIDNKPAWAGFDTATGLLSGTPSEAQVGSYANIVITVSDGVDSASLPAFAIEVLPAPVTNTPPVISGSPAGSVFSNSSYVFQPTASDADGDTLGFSITNKPAWASFNNSTGRLSGTPADANAGSYANIVISVSDGAASASLPAFTIEVNAAPVVNTPPVIGGTPAGLVTAGNAYAFQPTALDADGDTLGFSITNKPAWASFNTATGRLSGTPASGDTGFYGNIVISVSDGTDSTSLPAFAIQVDPSLGSFTLGWTAPVARTDGTALSLSEITEYRIYYGPAPGNYTHSMTVGNAAATSATVSNVQSGTWYVVMTTVDANGMESSQSTATAKTAN